jgi:hypothetical protein
MIQNMRRAVLSFVGVSVCIASCAMRPVTETLGSKTLDHIQPTQNNESSASQPIIDSDGKFKFPKSTFPLPYSAKIATETNSIAGVQQEVNIQFTNLSNKSMSLRPECWRPLEIIETRTDRIVLPVSSSFTCVAILFPPIILEPRASHLFRIGFWSGTGVNGQPVSPGTYTVRGAIKLNHLGKVEIVEATPLTIDVRRN